ncbi:E3 ubiquitin-protein ligase Topors [Toxorhynchites rutilus septentrionalis]|uniref:E3 ubiquitin-protein ligase Topors n=1 Tax=Toxorhynchites rutilus septentrionalis TaxID=329112 RepID=UPI002478FC9F|nr:E3 ubiquitin-protein ligase Topors [Toxorhynchites rutilus septentrionalis]
MEEVQVIDCPPTPEILIASNTPPSSTLLDMLESSSSAEELDNCSASAGNGSMESGRNSPPPKCAICLGKCRQKCYTDSCRHQFCYRCLLEWSKIKAECPLCKQVFRSIIYRQKAFDRYEEHIISIVPPASPPGPSNGDGPIDMGSIGGPRVHPQVYHRLDFTLSQPPRFTYSATLRVQPSQSERLQQLFLNQSRLVQRFSREFPNDSIPSRQNGPEWRRYIYHRHLYARPLPDINGRLRECSAAFYRENPAQIHRLMPWINRELVALCLTNPNRVTQIMENIPNELMTNDITSSRFRAWLWSELRDRTDLFIHELLNFARSPYDMIGYDRCVQYHPYYHSVVVLSSSSSSSSGSGVSASEGEDDVVRIVEPVAGTSGTVEPVGTSTSGSRRGRTQFTIETRSSDQTVIMTGSFGGAGVSGIVSVSTSGTQTGNAGPNVHSFPDMTRMHPLTSLVPPQGMSRLEDGTNISLSSSDSDDCRIVGALKPPHLRTPEMVSLESDSDSDVMVVNEEENRRIVGETANNAMVEQLFPENGLNHNSITKAEEHSSVSPPEYNNGASTSSGGGGSGMRKYYARPRLNRYSDGIGFKSIYEASESEKSKEAPSESDSSSHDEVKFNIRSQAPTNIRKRKVTKRRQAATPSVSSDDSSDQSSTSDSESTPSSSLSSSVSSSSSSSSEDNDRDYPFEEKMKAILKKRSHRSKVRSSRKSSQHRRKETTKRSKAKPRKSSKRHRKRQKPVPKVSPKSSSESGKGTSISCKSAPLTETVPSGSNASPPKSSIGSSSRKRKKTKHAIVKPNTLKQSSKRRRKAPICSELISSTDFSNEEEDQPEPEPAPEPAPMLSVGPVANHPSYASPVSSSVGGNNPDNSDDTSDSEGHCTIASLLRSTKQQPEEQIHNTSGASTASTASTISTGSSSNSSTSSSSISSRYCSDQSNIQAQLQQQQQQLQLQEVQQREHGYSVGQLPEDDVSVAQAIAVGAEVEL